MFQRLLRKRSPAAASEGADRTYPLASAPTSPDNSRFDSNSGVAESATSDEDEAGTSTVSEGWPSRKQIVIGRPTPEFEPRAADPVHRQFPYRPDTSLDGWSTDAFSLRAASVRGHLHRYNRTPRQDDFAVATNSQADQLIIAIADGVSAAPQSHVGSMTAVRYAVQWLAARVADPPAETDWRGLIESTAWALINQAATIRNTDDVNAEEAEQLLATTLVCAVVEANGESGATAHVVGVGDSGAWILHDRSFERLEGGKQEAESGLASSEVSGLPRVPLDIVPQSGQVGFGDVLLLGTDGFGDPLGAGDGEVGSLFRSLLLDRIPPLIEFAHALDFSRETFDDDRTLVAVWPRRTGPDD